MTLVLQTQCPVCHAAPGNPCTRRAHGGAILPIKNPHVLRRAAAAGVSADLHRRANAVALRMTALLAEFGREYPGLRYRAEDGRLVLLCDARQLLVHQVDGLSVSPSPTAQDALRPTPNKE